MTPEQIAFMNALLSATPGKTQAQKLNYLQDLGFDPFGKENTPYTQQAPTPAQNNVVGDTYGSNTVFAKIFNKIENGSDPITAVDEVRQELGEGAVPTYSDPYGTSNTPAASQQTDFYGIAADYAKENNKNAAQLAEWQQTEDAAKQQWEAAQKPTLNNALGDSQYSKISDIFGGPVTAKSLLDLYTGQQQQDRIDNPADAPKGNWMQQRGFAAPPPDTAAPVRNAANDFRDNIFSGSLGGYARMLANKKLNPKVEALKHTYDVSPKVEDLLSLLAAQRLN